MGSVYRAVRDDGEFEQKVAVKFIRYGGGREELLRRFYQERQLLARLNHPNIARLLDGGTTAEGMPYLVMEYIDGQPIDVYCDSRSVPITQRLELFRKVCAAVDAAHRALVVHCDLKPSNILVTSDGVLAALECVDYVTVFAEPTPHEILRRVGPQVLVKGGDYTPGEVLGREIVDEYGGEVRVLAHRPGLGSAAIIRRLEEV